MRRDYLLITGLAILFFFSFLGGQHLFDRDEIYVAERAREMLLTGEWIEPQLGFRPSWESPPMFAWAQAVSMFMFGVNEFAARFPNAVCGLITLLLVYRIGSRLHDRMFGWLWVLAWLGSFLPFIYFRTGTVDPWFSLLVFAGIYGFIEFRWQFLTKGNLHSWWQRYRYLLMGGLLSGMAVMTKGFAAYLVVLPVLGLYWARYRFQGKGYLNHLLMFSAAAVFPVLLWLGLEIALHGTEFTGQFLSYQTRFFAVAPGVTPGFRAEHILILLLGCFPVAAFALPNLWGDRQSEEEMLDSDTLASCKRSDFVTWMQFLFWTAFVLFCIAPASMIHYSSLCYFPLTYLGALTIWRAVRWEIRPKAVGFLLPVTGLVFGLAVMAVPFFPEKTGGILKVIFANDPLVWASVQADVQWAYWHGLPGLLLAAGSVAGFVFWQKNRPWLAAQAVFSGGMLFSSLTSLFMICNAEEYVQGAAIEFYQSKSGQNHNIRPVGLNTNAHLFYTRRKPCREEKNTYFVTKTSDLCGLPQVPRCRELYRKNGFVFFECAARGPAVTGESK